MSIPLDVLTRLDVQAKPRIHAHYDPPVYVCKACRMPDIWWVEKGQPPCTCPPVSENLPVEDEEDALTLEAWLATLT